MENNCKGCDCLIGGGTACDNANVSESLFIAAREGLIKCSEFSDEWHQKMLAAERKLLGEDYVPKE